MEQPIKLMDLRGEVRPWLDRIDNEILVLLHTRAKIVREVARIKRVKGETLQASEREASMLARMRTMARVLGVDLDFVSELWSLVIWHSKQEQCAELGIETFMNKEAVPDDVLRSNLEQLTGQIASEYDEFCQGSDALSRYLSREHEALEHAVAGLECKGPRLCLDIGCGNGRIAEQLADKFESLHAYDISSAMCEVASGRWRGVDRVSVESSVIA